MLSDKYMLILLLLYSLTIVSLFQSKKESNDGEEIDMITVFKYTHYNETKGWSTPLSEAKYVSIPKFIIKKE